MKEGDSEKGKEFRRDKSEELEAESQGNVSLTIVR